MYGVSMHSSVVYGAAGIIVSAGGAGAGSHGGDLGSGEKEFGGDVEHIPFEANIILLPSFGVYRVLQCS